MTNCVGWGIGNLNSTYSLSRSLTDILSVIFVAAVSHCMLHYNDSIHAPNYRNKFGPCEGLSQV